VSSHPASCQLQVGTNTEAPPQQALGNSATYYLPFLGFAASIMPIGIFGGNFFAVGCLAGLLAFVGLPFVAMVKISNSFNKSSALLVKNKLLLLK
jgi:hypothetical protein